MQVTVKLYGNLKRHMPDKKEIAPVELPPGTTIAALLARLGVPDSDVWMSAVNDRVVPETTELHDGDVVEIFEPVGGGCGGGSGRGGSETRPYIGAIARNRPCPEILFGAANQRATRRSRCAGVAAQLLRTHRSERG